MKIVLCLALVFAFISGFPKRQEVAITSLFKEWRGLIDKLPVEDILRDAAHDEVNDLFTRINEDRERGLFTNFLTQSLEDDVKEEFEDSFSLFADNTEKWFMIKVFSVKKDIAINLGDKVKDSAIALKNRAKEFIHSDENDVDNKDDDNNDDEKNYDDKNNAEKND